MRCKHDRITFATVTFILLFCVLIYRLANLQIVQGQSYKETALNNRLKEVTIESNRGDIFDRNMELLATSTYGESVAVFPIEISESKFDVQQMVATLAELLGMDEETVFKKLTSNSSFVWLKRKIPFETGPKIEAYDFPGVELFEEAQRYYPKGRTASQTLGFAGLDNQGLSGLELTYDEMLVGKPGKISIETDSLNREIPETVHSYEEPTQGLNLQLSINSNLQYKVEKRAAELLLGEEAEKVTIVVMNVKNGEILAMTGMPDFDPADYGNYPAENWLNPAVQEVYEPGSTFKLMSAAAMLDGTDLEITDHFYCDGFASAGGLSIKCWRYYRPHGDETFMEALGNSCNPVFVEAALRTKEKNEGLLYEYYKKLGFGQKTSMPYAAQAAGIMPEDNRDIYIATSAIGQGIAVTPVQLAAAVSTVIGDGTKIEPVLVKAILDENGNIVEEHSGRTNTQVIQMDTVMDMRKMMEYTVTDATGKNGAIEGYRTGGKTGTAQKPSESGGYYKDKFICSFVGVAPMEDPAVVCIVIVDAPSDPDASGGNTAGPTCAMVLKESLEQLEIAPDYQQIYNSSEETESNSTEEIPAVVAVPDLIGTKVEVAASTLLDMNLEPEYIEEGNIVTYQEPTVGSLVEEGSIVQLTLSHIDALETKIIVPDIKGLRVYQAMDRLDQDELLISVVGEGIILEQDPKPGTLAPRGSTVIVTCGKE